jgi:hypothetical protein
MGYREVLALGLTQRLFQWVKFILSEGYKMPENARDKLTSIYTQV